VLRAQKRLRIILNIEHTQWRRISAFVLTGVECEMRIWNLNASRIECLLQSVQEFTANTSLLKAGNLEAAAQHHC
jgi:hypothetical protein